MSCLQAEDIRIMDCSICGATCAPEPFWSHRADRLEPTCIELATAAMEMVAVSARTCEQWVDWRTRTSILMTQTPDDPRTKHIGNRLTATVLQIVRHRTRNADPAELCRAIGAHRPADGEAARIVGANQPSRMDKRWWRWPNASWVRCEKHRTWCAVGLHGNMYARYERVRDIVALHWIAARSRSCEEFRARCRAMTETTCTMKFVPAGRKGGWIRKDDAEEEWIALVYGAAQWSDMAPALGPWASIAARAFGNGNGDEE